MILDDRTMLVKIAPLRTEHSSVSIAIAWGDQFPKSTNHIIAIFNVYFGLERDRYNKTAKARDILIVLEPVWTDDPIIAEKEHQLMGLFIKRNQMIQVSHRVIRTIPPTSLEKEMGLKSLTSIIAPRYLTDTERKGGLKLPIDLSARVFEYLLDFDIIKTSLFNENHFFFQEKFLIDYEVLRFEGKDKINTKKCQDLFFSDQYYSLIEKKCAKCDNRASINVDGIHEELPKSSTSLLCTSCQAKVKRFYFFPFLFILKNEGISVTSPATCVSIRPFICLASIPFALKSLKSCNFLLASRVKTPTI